MINECLSSPDLREIIFNPHTGIKPTDHQKVTGSIPVWGSEIVFLRLGHDKHS